MNQSSFAEPISGSHYQTGLTAHRVKLATAEGYKSHGKLCEGKRGAVYRIKVHSFLNSKDEGEMFWFEDRQLVTIKIRIPNEDWDKVRSRRAEQHGI